MEARWGTDVFLEEAAGSAKEEKDMARGWERDGDLLKAPKGTTPFVIEGGWGKTWGIP